MADEQQAERYFQKALNLASKQQAKSLELRAAISIGRLWIGQGKKHEAKDLLNSIVSWFKTDSENQDLEKATALLQHTG